MSHTVSMRKTRATESSKIIRPLCILTITQFSDFCLLLLPLLENCASDYVEVSTLALEILDEISLNAGFENPAGIITKYLDAIISLLICRLRHVALYNSSPKVLSVILDLISSNQRHRL
jgi:hypothetical protein